MYIGDGLATNNAGEGIATCLPPNLTDHESGLLPAAEAWEAGGLRVCQ